MFQIVKPGFLYERPIAERHRIVFYIGHLEAFDWNLLRAPAGLPSFNPEFDRLFAFGIDPVDGEKPCDQPQDWPALDQVYSYVRRVRKELDQANLDVVSPELLNIALEHRLMHAETLEYLLHQLPFEAKVAEPESLVEMGNRLDNAMLVVPAGEATLGFDAAESAFGWDNEFAPHIEFVPAFSIDRYKVTNGEYLKFWAAGGYRDRRLWSAADWDWKEGAGIEHPVFWTPIADGFAYRSMFGEQPLPLDAPVFVSHAEASAYARWVGKRLPAEAEWQRAAEGSGVPHESRVLWNPPSIHASIASASRWGVEGMRGTGWEWTASEFQPFKGFTASPSYPGYSANFFDGKHFVMKGGSTRTAACMLRKSFRNWFQAHYQYVYGGFRCALSRG